MRQNITVIGNTEIVPVLQDILDRAIRGEIDSIAIAFSNKDSTSGNVLTLKKPVILLGELRILERDIIDLACDTRLHEKGKEY